MFVSVLELNRGGSLFVLNSLSFVNKSTDGKGEDDDTAADIEFLLVCSIIMLLVSFWYSSLFILLLLDVNILRWELTISRASS